MNRKIDLKNTEDSVLDVVDFEGGRELFRHTYTYVVSNLIFKLKQALTYGVSQDEREALFGEGINCQLLKPGADWQKGKLRISVEFIPDEVDSPLDDIRQAIASDDPST